MEGADHAAPAGAGYPPTGAALAGGYTPMGYPGPSVPHDNNAYPGAHGAYTHGKHGGYYQHGKGKGKHGKHGKGRRGKH
ncbi:hypothetical protein AB3S75_029677 [Citrus x aurantiifolia]